MSKVVDSYMSPERQASVLVGIKDPFCKYLKSAGLVHSAESKE